LTDTAYQLSLQFSNSKETLQHYLETVIRKPVSVILTDNSASVISIRTKNNSISVRMHWMFLKASEEVLREMAGFIKTRRGRTPLIGKFINENRTCLKKKVHRIRQTRILTQGRFFDLKEIFDSVNTEYFRGSVTSSISWGKKTPYKAVRKRTLGSYCRHTGSIRINPVLDRKYVPLYFIRFVVYHEMLHSSMTEQKKEGRRSVHNSEFRKCERLFREYEKAVSWEKRHGTR
jgi:hypothetical protein